MLFNSINYFLFLPAVLVLFWISPKRLRPALLLLASYFFYMSWLPIYGLLLFFLTVINYFIGFTIEKFRSSAKPIFILGIAINLGTLGFFKYTNFFLQSANDFLHTKYFPAANIILPLGISFFAFEFIHYISDVYKGDKCIKNPIHFGLFAAFFPSQIAGPIKRYQDFMHQLVDEKQFQAPKFRKGLELLLQGLFKKVALSDNLSPLVGMGFDKITAIGTLDTWIAVIAFTLQIYFDFSGYTDMGRGSAMMLGFDLPDNFNFPYMASSLSDFWKRWHISLSSWLRDYLYIPLGGGRTSRWRKHFNLMVTMLLGGLWHGAAWHFVAWGGLHGAGLVVNHEYDAVAKRSTMLTKWHQSTIGQVCAALTTLFVVVVGWVFFRAENTDQALLVLTKLFQLAPSNVVVTAFCQSTLLAGLSVYCLYAFFFSDKAFFSLRWLQSLRNFFFEPVLCRAVVYAAVFIAALGFSPSHAEPFIYFQF